VAERNKEHPYVMIVRATLQDSTLSWEARGMLAYLLSKPDNWDTRFSDLMEEGGSGRERTQKIIKELKDHGYIRRLQTRNAQGVYLPGQLLVFETPERGFEAEE